MRVSKGFISFAFFVLYTLARGFSVGPVYARRVEYADLFLALPSVRRSVRFKARTTNFPIRPGPLTAPTAYLA